MLSLILIIFAPFLATLFHYSDLEQYLRITALIFPAYGMFALFLGYYNGLHNFKKQALMNSIYSISKLILIVLMVIQFKLYGVIISFILAPIVSLVFGFKRAKTHKIFPYKRIIIFSLPLVAFAALSTLLLSIDLFSLKAYIEDPKIAGYYTAAQSIAIIPYFALGAVGQVLYPSISKYVGLDQHDKANIMIGKSLRYMLLIRLL
jgi:O-antigen/teichoic acid export membrane protein